MGDLEGLGGTWGPWEDLWELGDLVRLGGNWGWLEGLGGTGGGVGLGGRAELCHGRFEPDPHLFLEVEQAWGTPEICPTAWISVLGRPSKKSEGRKSTKFQRVGQILAGPGPGPTLRNVWGSNQNLAWPNLARPQDPNLGPGGPGAFGGLKLDPKKHEIMEG